jgi:phosphatidylserine decarboxylase
MLVREEALPFAGPLAVAGAVLAAVGHPLWAILPILAALAVCAFFRDPERVSDASSDAILAPADGKLIKIQDLGDGRLLISVFMSVFNVHVNRAPVLGTTESVAYNPGKFMAAWAEKASMDNEQTRITLSTPRGKVEVVQIAGLIARRIVCWAIAGRAFGRGERIGLIRFGSRVDLYLPASEVEVVATLDQVTKAGETVLARWRGTP